MAAAGWAMGRASADLLFTRDLGVASLLTRLPEGSRPPLVYESHGFSPAVSRDMGELLSNASGASPLKQRRLYRRERRVWHRADGYVTITAALAARLAATFGARPGVAVVPDGAAPAVPRDVRSPALTAGLTLGYAGHLYPWKGVDVLIDAMADLPRARALIIGGHPREDDLARLERRVRERGLRDRVELTGPIAPTDVARALARADVLVLPNRATTLSAEATSPLKLFEYMALGKPIVASDLPAIREIVGDGEAAELVAPDDPSALARGVARLVADPDRAAALAATALARSSDYSWDRRAERLAACFAEVVATR
jgi:glycosyltransferase involved in cell wall biosynthesis